MLVVTRRVGEEVVINKDVTVVVLEVHRNKVRLGVQADPSIPVYRKEIWVEIQKGREGDDASNK